MRRWIAAPVVFAAAAVLTLTDEPRPVSAQPPTPAQETIITADGVRLKALFHKSPTPKEGNPVVILLYPPGGGSTLDKPGDWEGLTTTLTKNGMHVFRFDWRGHGKSTDIVDPQQFWFNPITGPWNTKFIKGAPRKGSKSSVKLKNDLNAKKDLDANTGYFPVYANDLAAVRMYIDQLNDAGSLNSSSIYLIGAGDAATLGMLWTATEWDRPAIHPNLPNGLTYKVVPMPGIVVDPPAGMDIAASVWLSASRPAVIREKVVEGWVRDHQRMRENNPMLFLYGQDDAKAKTQADFFFRGALVANGNDKLGVTRLTETFSVPINKTRLNGVNLLGNNAQLGTEDTIVKFLEARMKVRATIVRKERKYPGPYFIDLRAYGL